MRIVEVGVPDDERGRLAECALEPIRVPGAVQPHGVLLALDPDTLSIVRVSDNTGGLFAIAPADLLGQAVSSLIGPDPVAALLDVLDEATAAANPTAVLVAGQPFDAIVHRAQGLVIVEFEPVAPATSAHSNAPLHGALRRFGQARSIPELWETAARELERISGFDRVMVYHFHPDGHGEIVGEEHADGMESYLGLHYPASDIPAQARALYLTKASRAIVSTDNVSATLLSLAGDDGEPVPDLDLGLAELRAVSPHHLEFMRNMGQASTMSLSLVQDGVLIGMITCAHRTRRSLAYEVRKDLEAIAGQIALQLGSMTAITDLTRVVAAAGIRGRLIAKLAVDEDIAAAMLFGDVTAFDLVRADGVMISLDGAVSVSGNTPTPDELAALVVRRLGDLRLVSSALATEHPEVAAVLPGFAGLLLLPLGSNGNYVAWFRREITQTLRWLGDQSPANRVTPLSPRNSFSEWTETVRGTSLPWDSSESDALELCRDIEGVLLRRAEATLASLALHDTLTGLPNRRLLMDRLEQGLRRNSRGEPLALLFIDLDGFKAINDSLGHEIGDALLVHASTQIVASTRANDTVARLGGDEFVVLCGDTEPAAADEVAARIVSALRTPIELAGRTVGVTASVGIAIATPGVAPVELIRGADVAMYRAKAAGRDRASR